MTDDPDRHRYLWLALGAALAMLSVGGTLDLPSAAWLAPVLLLRFTRISRLWVGLPLVWLVCVAAPLLWMVETVVPVNPVALLGCVAFGTVFALPYMLDRWVGGRIGAIGRLWLFPAALAAAELLMGVLNPLGTAYGLLAVTQRANLPLLQVLALLGPYAIGFLIGWFATTANRVWEGPLTWPDLRVPVGAFAVVLVAVVAGGEARLSWFATPEGTRSVRVAGLTPSAQALAARQAAIGGSVISLPALAKADPTSVRLALTPVNDEMLAGTHRASQAGAKIVLWSENASMSRDADLPAFLDRAAALAEAERIYLLVAVNVVQAAAPYGRDETHLIGPDGARLWTYNKAHPIPGLETYVPGPGRAPVVETPYGRLANVICYDADFPAMMGARADIMLVPGGDWPQMGRVHTGMASLRAIENGYALVRQDVNGLSAAYDHQGRILATQDTTGAGQHMMLVDVPIHGVAPLYRLLGDWFGWLCAAATLGWVGLGVMRRRHA